MRKLFKYAMFFSVFVLPASLLAQEVYESTESTTTVQKVDDADDKKNFPITPSINMLHLPHPFNAGLEFTFSESFSIKLSKSLEPSATVDGHKAKFDNRSVSLRSYPGAGSFFFGVGYGKHEISASRYEEINGFRTRINGYAKAEYLNPMIGWKWVYDSGFTIGMELGWVFPFNDSVSVRSNQDLNPLVSGNADFQRYRDEAEDAASKYAKDGIPSIGLLEIGWTF